MTEEELERALQPFGQAKPSTTRNYGGTGLGLPITKGLIEAHGGKLAIESRAGQGTIARISLPTARKPLMAGAWPQPLMPPCPPRPPAEARGKTRFRGGGY